MDNRFHWVTNPSITSRAVLDFELLLFLIRQSHFHDVYHGPVFGDKSSAFDDNEYMSNLYVKGTSNNLQNMLYLSHL